MSSFAAFSTFSPLGLICSAYKFPIQLRYENPENPEKPEKTIPKRGFIHG
jgi:hypothetical protein